mgnify:CR=1 FL=1
MNSDWWSIGDVDAKLHQITTKKLIKMRLFVEAYILGEKASNIDELTGEFKKLGQIDDAPLLDHIPGLVEDVPVPDWVDEHNKLYLHNSHVDIAPETARKTRYQCATHCSVQPLRRDMYHQMMCQVAGFKYVRVFPPDQIDKLYPYPQPQVMTFQSRVNVLHPDAQEHPLYNDATFQETVLRPGDLLYIPKSYWKFSRALTYNTSTNWKFDTEPIGGKKQTFQANPEEEHLDVEFDDH